MKRNKSQMSPNLEVIMGEFAGREGIPEISEATIEDVKMKFVSERILAAKSQVFLKGGSL